MGAEFFRGSTQGFSDRGNIHAAKGIYGKRQMLHKLSEEKLLTLECLLIMDHQVWTSSRWWDRQSIESRPLTWPDVPSVLMMLCLLHIRLCPCFLPDISHHACTYVYSPSKSFFILPSFPVFLSEDKEFWEPSNFLFKIKDSLSCLYYYVQLF